LFNVFCGLRTETTSHPESHPEKDKKILLAPTPAAQSGSSPTSSTVPDMFRC
jgi:hypothetical protein